MAATVSVERQKKHTETGSHDQQRGFFLQLCLAITGTEENNRTATLSSPWCSTALAGDTPTSSWGPPTSETGKTVVQRRLATRVYLSTDAEDGAADSERLL